MSDAFRRDTVKREVSIYDVLAQINVELPEGAQPQQVRCPFHTDTRPSARVYDDHLHCFTCGQSWDAIAIVAQTYGLRHTDAIAWLEDAFQVVPEGADPRAAMRVALRAAPPRTLDAVFAFAEDELRRARNRLTLGQFACYTTALDLLIYQHRVHAITPDVCAASLRKLVGKLS
jgi:DNA primase